MNDSKLRPTQEPLLISSNLRFFVASPLTDRLKDIVSVVKGIEIKRVKGKPEMLRYEAYLRISFEEQVGNYS